jgi:Zn-dependent peptidase ImmA (M78 family)
MLEGELTAISRAWEFQKKAEISERPVQIEKYLAAADADLRVRHDLKDSEAGQTFQIGSRHIIVVNGNHTPERQRFTILHELAHIVLELPSNHAHSVSVDQLLRYNKRPREEVLCDVFASECLLPRRLFQRDVLARPCSFTAVDELATLYEASLSATGSRFAAYSKSPCSWILADDRYVRFVSCSSALRDTGFFVRLGIEVPRQSVLGRLGGGTKDVQPGVPYSLPAHVWINNDCRSIEELTETAVLAPLFSQGVALLVAEIGDEGDRREPTVKDQEDVLLHELDGVLRFPGRRSRR